METLENCPLCGGEAMLKDVHGKIRHGWVGCPECRLYINWNISPGGAVQKWNRRALPDQGARACAGRSEAAQ